LNLYAGSARASADGSADPEPDRRPVPGLKRWSFLAAVILWCLAIGSRENALVLPVLAVAFDLAFGGWRQVRARRGPYAIMAAIMAAFLLWRAIWYYHPMPDFYLRRPDGLAYLAWCAAKLMHYLTAAVWLSPLMFGPTLRFNPFREVPGDCLLMFAILAVMGAGYYLACRRARGYWIWPMWILLAVLPVVPVMATPHSGYMPGVGFAVAMIIGPALRREIEPVSIGRWSPAVALWFLVATTTYMPIYRAMWYSVNAAERLTIARITAAAPPAGATDLFFINLPFVNIYVQPHLHETWAKEVAKPSNSPEPAPRCHVLTYSSNVLRMEQRCRLEQLDANSFRLSIEGRPFFSGALGRFLIESMRDGRRMQTGEVIPGDLFNVEIVRADQEGVREMVFRFPRPLADARYFFYMTTNQCAAARVKFWGPEPPHDPTTAPRRTVGLEDVKDAGRRLASGRAGAAGTLFAAMESDDPQVRSAAWAGLGPVARLVAKALASPVQDLLGAREPARADLLRLRRWWERCVDEQTLDALWVRRDDFTADRQTRDALFRIREIAARVIKTDLYLTDDKPFPGPR